MTEYTILLKIKARAPIPDIVDKIANRVSTFDQCQNQEISAEILQGETLAVIKQIEAKRERKAARL